MNFALRLDRIAARADELRHMLSGGISGEAFVKASREPGAAGNVYNAGNGGRFSLNHIWSLLQKIEGVETVTNEVRVLPLSSFDDRIRIAAYRAIYGTSGLNRYVHQAMPPIHILVENGNITLEGVVANEFDRNLAYMKAMGVHGVFSVTNHLEFERQN